jgi:carbonic anhydrase/acetyltransferase-like protein (isoleucine patch superfamily)
MPLYKFDGIGVSTPASGAFWVAPNAVLLGKVKLGEDASVWFSAVLRGDNELITVGARSNVQDGCVLHTDPGFPLTIAEDCTIGHMAMLHGCTIGRGSLIGIGSIILNGAEIGEECVIGAGALIPEGKIIPPRSMVLGSPGKVVRQLSDEEAHRFGDGARRYVDKWKHYADGLKPQT